MTRDPNLKRRVRGENRRIIRRGPQARPSRAAGGHHTGGGGGEAGHGAGRRARRPRLGRRHPAVAIADIDNRLESIDTAVTQARPWRRLARAGAYDAHLVTDERSDDRRAF
jgi:hypothetical protein